MHTRIALKKRGSVSANLRAKRGDLLSSQKKNISAKSPQTTGEIPSTPPFDLDSLDVFKSFVQFMRQKHNLSLLETIELCKRAESETEILVPLSIFSTILSPSESLCKYLKENKGLSYHQIADLLNRDDRSVWTSYKRAVRKYDQPFEITKDILLPVSIFRNRVYSMLESIVKHLQQNFSFSGYRIAKKLNKDPSTIATVIRRIEAKEKGEG